jgi:hypothetical protein
MNQDKKNKRSFRLCEYSAEQEQFIKVRMERDNITYSALARIGMSLLMKHYKVDVPEKNN